MYLSQAQFDLAEQVSKHITPIVFKENQIFKPLGSGVFIRKNDQNFLITALHVIESKEFREIYLFWREKYIQNIPAETIIKINHPAIDLAICPVKDLPVFCEPIEYNLLNNCSGFGAEVLLAGYPASRQKTNDNKIIFERRFIYSTVIEGKDLFSHFDERANIVCDFKQKKITNGSGTICRFPDLWGMSGGPMFEIFKTPNEPEITYRLAGIMTEWNTVLRKYIRCTNISIVCTAIDKFTEAQQHDGN